MKKIEVSFPVGSSEKLMHALKNIHGLMTEGWEISSSCLTNLSWHGGDMVLALSLQREEGKLPEGFGLRTDPHDHD